MTKLLQHSAQSATIQLGQLELQLLMALVQDGRHSLGCTNDFGESLDQFFVSANILVEEERRELVKIERSMGNICNLATGAGDSVIAPLDQTANRWRNVSRWHIE